MGYVQKLLASNERVVRVSHDHWIVLLTTILIDGLVALIIAGLSVAAASIFATPLPMLGLLLLAVPTAHLLFRIWVWWNTQCIVTNLRIIQIRGMMQKRVSDTLLEKINDIVTEQTALGRLLNYGDLKIVAGSDSGVDVFYHLADPIGFKRDLLDQKAAFGQSEVPKPRERVAPAEPDATDVPELIAELDDLRKKGLLTDAEFQEKRRKLLDRI
ncbi:MAG: PH domain-containing protein [Anaerolineae bacterium]|nr:PH domain-containing protein [Anaerolineae bacterium]